MPKLTEKDIEKLLKTHRKTLKRLLKEDKSKETLSDKLGLPYLTNEKG